MNIKKAIPTVSGIITGIFMWDLQMNKGPGVLILLPLLFAVLFNFVWIFYSIVILKKDHKKFEKDALTFIPFLFLILFPVRYFINVELKYSKFGNVPSELLLIFAISSFIFLKVWFYEEKIKDFGKDRLIYIIMILYFAIFTALSIAKHNAFYSTGYDLGIYDQGVWGLTKFKLSDSVMGFPIIGGHFEPILFLIAIFYWIYSSPITLLIIQTMMISLCALPIYLLAKKVLKNRLIAYSLSIVYFLYPSVEYSNLFDFHPMVLALPFMFFAFYFLEKRDYKAFLISMIIAGSCKEYIPLVLTPLGIFIFLTHKKRILGSAIALFGLLWFILNITVIIPYFLGNNWLMLKLNPDFGLSFGEVMKTTITNPMYLIKYLLAFDKISFLILLATPIAFGFFAFLAPEFLLLGITEFLAVLLHIRSGSISEIVYHHQSISTIFIIVATIYGIKRFIRFAEKSRKIPTQNIMPAAGIILVVTSLLANISYGPFSILYDLREFNQDSDYVKTGNKFVSMIPKYASVAAPNWVLPHLSQRDEIYWLSFVLRKDYDLPPKKEQVPEYIIMDLSQALIDPKRSGLKLRKVDIDKLFNDKEYGIIAAEGSWLLLKKGSSYEDGICNITPFLNKINYPHLNIEIKEKELLKKC